MQLTAHFVNAVFNVTWWNLFQNGEDIGQAEDCTCGSYTNCNERLWRLFQVEYNNYLKNNGWGTQTDPTGKNNQLQILGFLNSGNNSSSSSSIKNNDFLRQKLDAYFKDNTKLFYWLGQYIQNTPTKKTIDAYASYNGQYMYKTYDIWGWFLQAFINRQDNLWRMDLGASSSSVAGHPAKQFSTYGKPAEWRPHWTDAICGLSMTMNYSDAMPITWKQNASPSGTIKPYGTSITHNPSSWYKWNTADGKLLAWRNGGATTQYPIVHHVDDDMALYATYVDKHIHENDPAVSGQNDATNEDVIKLLANPKYKEAEQTHTLTVTRKLQPGMYNTLCLPFGVNINSLANGHPLKNADVRQLTSVTKELYTESGESVMVLNFEQVTTTEPGKPYLVKLADGQQATETLTFSGVYCSDYDALQSDSDNEGLFTFHPTYDPIDIPAGAIILVADNRLALTTESGRMEGLRGYFTINPELMSADDIQEKAMSGRIYLSMNAPTTTSVPLAPDAEKQEAPKAQKIMRNGKIYILRDGKTYSITGARVE